MAENTNQSLERISGEGEESVETRKAASAAETVAAAGNLSEDELASVAGGTWSSEDIDLVIPNLTPPPTLDERDVPLKPR